MQILAPLNRLALAMAAAGLIAGSAAVTIAWLSAAAPARRPLAALPVIMQGQKIDEAYRPMATEGEALRRPLFTATRRPPPKPASQMTAANEAAPDIAVNGIISGSDVGAVAGIDKRTQKPFSLRVGESIGDWQVDTISRSGLRLRRDDQVRDYPLQLPLPPPKAQR